MDVRGLATEPTEAGHRLLAQGRVKAALRAFQEAVDDRPQFVTARLGMLRALIGLNDEAGATTEALLLCELLAARGDRERIPDIRAMVTEQFPSAWTRNRDSTVSPGRALDRRRLSMRRRRRRN